MEPSLNASGRGNAGSAEIEVRHQGVPQSLRQPGSCWSRCFFLSFFKQLKTTL
jgi:hypothetical protein